MKKMLLGAFVLSVGLVIGWFWKNKPTTFVPSQSVPVVQNKTNSFGASITLIDGNVEYREAKGDWKRAEVNTVLKEGYSVEVLGEGRVVISLDDGSAVRVGSQSSVTLNTLQANGITISNNKGQVYTRVVKADRSFFVRVGSIVYQSLGTAYKTINEPAHQGVEVYESKVKVIGASESEVVVDSGSKFDVLNTNDKKSEKKLAMLEVKKLKEDQFVQWNKEQDKMNSEFKDKLGVLDDSYQIEIKNGPDQLVIENSEKKEPVKKVEKKEVKKVSVESGSVTSLVIKSSGEGTVSWNVAGYSEQGFKVVWSRNENPTYPTRDGDKYNYLSDPSARTSSVDAFAGGGAYYVRVCEYLGGKCGIYSNQIKVTLE